MDLFRVVTATGDVSKPPAKESAREFLDHALNDFDKFENTYHEKKIKEELKQLYEEMFKLDEPNHRLRWTENVLTARCRIS